MGKEELEKKEEEIQESLLQSQFQATVRLGFRLDPTQPDSSKYIGKWGK